MSPILEKNTLGDVVLFEAEAHYSRDVETIGSGADLEIGTVLGQITASKKFVACDPTAADGSEVAVAVLGQEAKAATEDVQALIISRHARFKRSGLVFSAAIDDAPKRATAVAQLKAAGLLTDI
jgi:hypothetical protein